MNNVLHNMYTSLLLENGFDINNCNTQCDRAGRCYTVQPKKGHGHVWVYCHRNLFSISIQNFVLHEDLYVEYMQPQYISINYYDSISGQERSPYRPLLSNCVKGHIGCDNVYQAVYHKNVPICSTGIVIMPEYYEDYLRTHYAAEYENPRAAFASIDGTIDFPELVFLFRQIRNFRGTGLTAKLYYEGKVAEAISLIMDKTSQPSSVCPIRHVSAQDVARLATVAAYIDEHLALNIRLDQLARIACMGTTKLKYTFKEVHKCTITDFIQHKRVCQAEQLLTNTDMNINQIAQTVGYTNSSRFSALFRKNTGLLPNEYRKRAASK